MQLSVKTEPNFIISYRMAANPHYGITFAPSCTIINDLFKLMYWIIFPNVKMQFFTT